MTEELHAWAGRVALSYGETDADLWGRLVVDAYNQRVSKGEADAAEYTKHAFAFFMVGISTVDAAVLWDILISGTGAGGGLLGTGV